MNRTFSLTMMNVSSKIQHKCFFLVFFLPAPTVFIYLFIIASESGLLLSRLMRRLAWILMWRGREKPACRGHPHLALCDQGLLQMDVGFHQSASNSAGKA